MECRDEDEETLTDIQLQGEVAECHIGDEQTPYRQEYDDYVELLSI